MESVGQRTFAISRIFHLAHPPKLMFVPFADDLAPVRSQALAAYCSRFFGHFSLFPITPSLGGVYEQLLHLPVVKAEAQRG